MQRLADGENVGTFFDPGEYRPTHGKKVWLGTGALARGMILCDAGAQRAVKEGGASLLPSGIVAVRGEFNEGEVVEIADEAGKVFARGLAVYSAEELRAIAGHHSDEIEAILDYKVLDAAIHRDNLLVL